MEASDWTIAGFVGYSSEAPHALLARALEAQNSGPGDYVVAGTSGAKTAIATSALGARPYYYALAADGALCHGDGLFDVVARAGLGWRWSRRGLLSFLLLGHTTGDDTLHESVFRVPPDSLVLHEHGKPSIRPLGFWDDVLPGADLAVPQDPLGGIGEELLTDDDPLLSLSAGFDSRALLGLLLRLGRRPVLGTMGGRESTDLEVARVISRDLGLELREVALLAADYLPAAREIVRATGGAKGAAHWHTYLYARGLAGGGGGRHFVGSNGEYARTFYFDKGLLARAADLVPLRGLRIQFFARLMRRRRRLLPIGPLRDADRSELLALAEHLVSLSTPARSSLDALDRFYAQQRVRHFIGNGLALYAACGDPVSPFLDARWIAYASRLPRNAKLGARYHRSLVADNAPELLRYRTDREATMARTPPRGYWRRSLSAAGYSPFNAVAASDEVQELLRSSPYVEELLPEARRAFTEAEVDLLLPLHFVRDVAGSSA